MVRKKMKSSSVSLFCPRNSERFSKSSEKSCVMDSIPLTLKEARQIESYWKPSSEMYAPRSCSC